MTPTEVNALPERVRRYIHDLETNADPAGMVRANVLLRDQVEYLGAMVEELQKDSRRLDWLETFSADRGYQINEWFKMGGEGRIRYVELSDSDDSVISSGPNVREAIDRAIDAMGAGGGK